MKPNLKKQAQRAGPKRACLYTRVSTDEQAKSGYSLPSQLEGCRNYAEAHTFAIIAELADDCSGTIPIPDRPEGKKLYELVDRGELDAVIIFTHDRLSRDPRMIEHSLFKDYLHRHNVELHFSDTGLDPHTLEAGLIANIKAYLAAADNAGRREKTTRGRVTKAQSNHLVMSGIPPYGYQREGERKDAKMIVYEPEARVVRLIYQWYIYGENGNAPLSLYAIARKLDEMGEPTKQNQKHVAKQWDPATIRSMLLNSVYSGTSYYQQDKMVDGQRIKQPRSEWIAISVPELAIVPERMIEAARERAKRNSELSRRHQKHEYLLSGFFRCGVCGKAMVGKSATPTNTALYRCGSKFRLGVLCAVKPTVGRRKAERLAWGWLSHLLEDEKKLDRGLRAMAKRAKKEIGPKQERLDQIERLQAEAEAKVKRLVANIGDETDETIAAALDAQLKQIAAQVKGYKQEAQDLNRELARKRVTAEAQERIKKQAREIRLKLDNATFEQRRGLIEDVHFSASIRKDEEGRRWLDVRCGLNPNGKAIALSPLRRERLGGSLPIGKVCCCLLTRCGHGCSSRWPSSLS